MPKLDALLKEIFLNKPELVIQLPEGLLSSPRIDTYQAIPKLAIVEIAGRDSVAAAVKGVEKEGFTDLVPTYAYTGTEHGPWTSVSQAVKRLTSCLPDVRVHDLLALGSPGFWQAMNGRFMSEIIARFGCFTPCVGCHLYLHSVRVPLARTLGNVPIISGERELHNGNIKINQSMEVLNRYQNLVEGFGIQLLLPLKTLHEGRHIEEILGFDWREGREQLECTLSGNYRFSDKGNAITEKDVLAYLDEFAIPCATEIINAYITGNVPNHMEMAAQVLRK